MIEGLNKIRSFQRGVTRRLRALELQDSLVLAVGVGAIVSAAAVLVVRLRPFQIQVWPLTAALLGAAVLGGLVAWFYRRPGERAAIFMIDGALGLDDRLITAASIDSRGGPHQPIEHALIEDAAARINDQKPSAIVPYRWPRHISYGLIGLVTLTVAITIPQKALPQSEEAAVARADIQSAGEMLAESAAQIGEAIEPGTTTARLAKEQGDLGQMLKASGEDRADALKKLSALGDRIQQRHRELQETRADDIVSLADQRLRAALEPKSNSQRAGKKMAGEGDAGDGLKDAPGATGAKKDSGDMSKAEPSRGQAETAGQTATPQEAAGQAKQSDASNKTPADNRNGNAAAESAAGERAGADGQNRPQEPVSGGAQVQAGGQQGPDEPAGQGDKGEQKDAPGESGGLAGALAGQAAKALPSMSGELLKKAAELRADQLDPATISALAKAAGSLAKDLSSIAQSKDFQQALEGLARQVNPEQLERVARELMKNEQLMRELEAAARLLAENQQAKELVAGLARSLGAAEESARERAARNGGQQSGTDGQGAGRGRAGRDPSKQGAGRGPSLSQATNQSEDLTGRGRDVRVSGNPRRGSGGEYLYLPSKAGTGSARAPYSTAYPQYRREAERAVRRSQVPPHLRSVVRGYFDAINPDGKKN